MEMWGACDGTNCSLHETGNKERKRKGPEIPESSSGACHNKSEGHLTYFIC
jgi:hypothetical protein